MFLRVLFWALLIWLGYRFIFHFIIPVFRATRELKSKMNQFREQMEAGNEKGEREREREKEKGGDYIEFEEL
jgi:Sec-independent protein translocase protein TatA